MVALSVTVKVLPFVINPRQWIFGWVYDRTNAQQHKRLGSVGHKSVQHTPRQDDTFMQAHHPVFITWPVKSCAALHDNKQVVFIGVCVQLVFTTARIGLEHHIELRCGCHDLVGTPLFGELGSERKKPGLSCTAMRVMALRHAKLLRAISGVLSWFIVFFRHGNQKCHRKATLMFLIWVNSWSS